MEIDLKAYKLDKAKVESLIVKDKKYDHITQAGFGKIDELLSFMHGIGIYNLIKMVDSCMKRKVDIPRSFIHATLALRPILEITGINQVPSKLFANPVILKKMGLSLEIIEKGFSPKNKAGKNLPHCLDTIYDEAKRVKPCAWEKLLAGQVVLFACKKFIKRYPGIYALDATDIEVGPSTQYENIGKVAKEVSYIDKNGNSFTKIEIKYGYKLLMLQSVEADSRYIIAAALVPLNVHEDSLAYALVKSAYDVLGPGYIKTIIADRAFFDGDLFRKLLDLGIDFIVPAKANTQILSDMKGLVKLKANIKATTTNGEIIYGFSSLSTLSSCIYKLNGILTEDGHGFVTSLKVDSAKSLIKTFDLYPKRWNIENYGFRELKEYWNIDKLPGKKFNSVYMHIFLILVMFNTVIAYKSNRKDKFVARGFLSLIKANFSYTDEMIIYRDGYVGIFSLKEFLELMNLPPPSEEAVFRIIKYPQDRRKIW
ncbi:MAG: transposase [Actinobacteria bacterium]|nr:transposase [Actinomycetota bacterium]